jgi:hypothetical protein
VVAKNTFANQWHDKLTQLSSKERNAVLTKAVNASDQGCDMTIKSFFQGFDDEKKAYWNVECRDKKTYLIRVTDEGSSTVVACSALKSLKAGECFKTFEELEREQKRPTP